MKRRTKLVRIHHGWNLNQTTSSRLCVWRRSSAGRGKPPSLPYKEDQVQEAQQSEHTVDQFVPSGPLSEPAISPRLFVSRTQHFTPIDQVISFLLYDLWIYRSLQVSYSYVMLAQMRDGGTFQSRGNLGIRGGVRALPTESWRAPGANLGRNLSITISYNWQPLLIIISMF